VPKWRIQDYPAPESAWYALGKTPMEHVRIPKGYFRWRLSRAGARDYIGAPLTNATMQFPFEVLGGRGGREWFRSAEAGGET